jgi:beta-lactamase superfamily II metal-dependent hydrolase
MSRHGLRLGLVAALALAAPQVQAATRDLRIISVDVEGGAATLYVTPDGKSLLIDTGFPAGMGGPRPGPGEPPAPPAPSSAERIVAAAKAAGLKRLDYVLVSHYHLDHIGGIFDLLKLMPIGAFIDHGPNREAMRPNPTPAQAANAPASLYPRYEVAIAGKRRITMLAGDRLRLGGLTLQAVNSDGAAVTKPLTGRANPGADCASATGMERDGGEENPRSVGLLLRWGKARILSLADTTWTMENTLVCPVDLIGPVDLMFSNNHGSEISNSPNLLRTVQPRVLLVNNGPTKGGDASILASMKVTPRLEGLWQLHFATRSPEDNTAPELIANIERDSNHNLDIIVKRSGSLTVRNMRTGQAFSYR